MRHAVAAVACALLSPVSAAGACTCSGVSSDPQKRPDYGTVCASWDGRDEKPWCAVAGATDCGADDTFESTPGVWWAHAPCDSTPLSPPPPLPPPPLVLLLLLLLLLLVPTGCRWWGG